MRTSLNSTRRGCGGSSSNSASSSLRHARVVPPLPHQRRVPLLLPQASITNDGGVDDDGSYISEQHQQQPARWLLRPLRLVAASALLLGASAASPLSVRAARAAALQPPQQHMDKRRQQQQQQQQQSQQQQQHKAGPMQLAVVAALPSQTSPSASPAQQQQQQQQQQQHSPSGALQQHAAPGHDGGGGGGSGGAVRGGDMKTGAGPAAADDIGGAGAAGAAAAGSGGAAAAAADLLAVERRVTALFEANKASVVSVGHVRSMHHFHTLDVARMAPGQGTGFIWDRAGHVVVAAHAVRGASEVKVTLPDAGTATARVVGADAVSGIAVLQLALPRTRTEALRPVTLGSSAGLRIGQLVWCIGNPWGLDHTLSQGIVSGLGREMGGAGGLWALKGCIQTDAAVNPGNSGGPLLDSGGRVVGVALALHNSNHGAGVGHAAPIDAARRVVEQLLAHGRVKRPSLGIVPAPPQVLAALGGEGVLALEVPAGSPAAAAGLRATYRDVFGDIVLGDVIVGIDTRPVRGLPELLAALDDKRPGDRVRCDVLRDGKRLSMTVLLGERAPGAAEE